MIQSERDEANRLQKYIMGIWRYDCEKASESGTEQPKVPFFETATGQVGGSALPRPRKKDLIKQYEWLRIALLVSPKQNAQTFHAEHNYRLGVVFEHMHMVGHIGSNFCGLWCIHSADIGHV